jgi:putative endonuclease
MTHWWYIYFLRLHNGRLYVGITPNPKRRFEEHKQGLASRVARTWGTPTSLTVVKAFRSYNEALAAENRFHKVHGTQYLDGRLTPYYKQP